MISSHRNALAKRIRKLQRKKYREQEGAFFVEGIRVVLTALEQNAPVQTLVYAPELLSSETALAAVETQKRLGRDVVAVSREVFQAFSERDHAVGLGAIISAQVLPVERLQVGPTDIVAAVDEISDPGNLGTIIRTVDAVGGGGVILLGQSTDPFHPTAVRASMGAVFSVPLARLVSAEELFEWARTQQLQVVATSAHAERSFWNAPYRTPVVLLLGSEGEGLAPEVQAQADLRVSIPMHGVASSLNLAVAAGLLLYELRRAAPLSDPAA